MAGTSTDEEAGKILKTSFGMVFLFYVRCMRLKIRGNLWTENFDTAISKGPVLLEKNVICYICMGPEA